MKILLKKFIRICGGKILKKGSADPEKTEITCLVTDSRKLAGICGESSAFLCLVGEKFDGNRFAGDAIDGGVALVVTSYGADRPEIAALPEGKAWVVSVEDTLKTLGDVGAYYRSLFRLPVVGITGSVGKTTTKEFTYRCLSAGLRTLKTEANFNNEIGVPMTMLKLDGTYDAAVVEMGMRGFGQITYLSGISRPTVAIVTNIGFAHLEFMGTKQNTLRAKLEIAGGMKDGGVLLLNGDDELLRDRENVERILREEYGANPRIVYYGTGDNASVRGEIREVTPESCLFTVTLEGKKLGDVSMHIPGAHNVLGALAGIGAAVLLGVEPEKALAAVAAMEPIDLGRQKVGQIGGVTVIDDAYNAGPESVKAQLGLLSRQNVGEGGRRIAFLGDMLELGGARDEAHESVGRRAAELGIDVLVCVGPISRKTGKGAAASEAGTDLFFRDDSVEAAELAAELVKPGDAVLVKGSHAMQMEKITAALKEKAAAEE